MKRYLLIIFSVFLNYSCTAKEVELFKYQGKSYSKSDLPPKQRAQLYEADEHYYNHLNNIIDGYVFEQYIESEAKKQKISREKLEKKLFPAKNFGEKEAKAWFDKNKFRLGGRTFNSIKSQIIGLLKEESKKNHRTEIIKKIRQDKSFELFVKEPELKAVKIATTGFPTKGNKKAKYKVVEFADYGCPHCKTAAEQLKKIVNKYKDKIEFTFMDFPLRDNTKEIAKAAFCAKEQNKFWDFHYKAFELQNQGDTINKVSKALKLDNDKFKKCLLSKKAEAIVNKSKEIGENIGVSGTPAVYLNGKLIAIRDLEKELK